MGNVPNNPDQLLGEVQESFGPSGKLHQAYYCSSLTVVQSHLEFSLSPPDVPSYSYGPVAELSLALTITIPT